MQLNKKFTFIFSLAVAVFATAETASADAAAANKFCNYLSDSAAKAKPTAGNGLMIELGGNLIEINNLKNMAVNAKLNFDEYKALVLKQTGVVLSDAYKSFYLYAYVAKYCGQGKTEAGVSDEKTKSISSGQLKSFSKEPDVEEHSYYQEYKAKEAKAAK